MKSPHRKLKRAAEIFRAGGWRGIKSRAEIFRRKYDERRAYGKWIKIHELKTADRESLRRRISEFSNKPLISIVLPVYNVEEKWLRLCVESVLRQIYAHWELCIADDCSTKPHVRRVLEEYAARDARIKIVFRPENNHISAASNSALKLANGEFAALLDHDDELAEDALFWVVKEINDFPDADFIYTDEDMIDRRGRRFEPKFKPDFSPDFLYSLNYVTHLAVYRTAIAREVGGFRRGFEGSQDYDLTLRVVEKIGEKKIRHISRILYHWRAIKGSVALSESEKPYAHERARRAIAEHFARTGVKASVAPMIYNFHRISYDLPEKKPKVSVLISIDENIARTKKTLADYAEKTNYQNYEFVLIGSEKTKKALENLSFPVSARVVAAENSAAERLNAAAEIADGDVICFAAPNLKPFSADWLDELTSFAGQKEIGAVGAKILSAGATIRHAGLIVGTEKTAESAHENRSKYEDGNLFRLKVVSNFSAVSNACFATRREIFMKAGGFAAKDFPENFFAADYCLRLREKNLRIVFTPHAELIETTSGKISQTEIKIREKETQRFRQKWSRYNENDPFYNRNFSYESGNFTVKI